MACKIGSSFFTRSAARRNLPSTRYNQKVSGVYLAYPFCAQKCTYCNFASGVFPRALEPLYLEALQLEVRAHPWQWIPETVYLGGGTPSQMDPADLAGLLALIPGHPWREATVEAAPGTITREKARAWGLAGINRVSLGAQSFVETEIRKTGRMHTAQTVTDDIRALAAAGITNYNVDLIAGLAAQTESSWRESLDWIERLAPPHVSVYMLEVDDDSRLGKEMRLGGVRYFANETPSENQTADFYELAAERLASLGIQRYEISNFARPGFESRHNLKYWTLEPYAGFGADAHSFDGMARTGNPEDVDQYIARRARESSPANVRDEKFFVGLRLSKGVRPTSEDWNHFSQPIRRFLDSGLLETDGDLIRLTPRGIMLSNEVFQEFLAA
jgi:oxygen-independent coproporphyrinogen-3 oxidase